MRFEVGEVVYLENMAGMLCSSASFVLRTSAKLVGRRRSVEHCGKRLTGRRSPLA